MIVLTTTPAFTSRTLRGVRWGVVRAQWATIRTHVGLTLIFILDVKGTCRVLRFDVANRKFWIDWLRALFIEIFAKIRMGGRLCGMCAGGTHGRCAVTWVMGARFTRRPRCTRPT